MVKSRRQAGENEGIGSSAPREQGAHPCAPLPPPLVPLPLPALVLVLLELPPELLLPGAPTASGVSPDRWKPDCSCCTTDCTSAGTFDAALAELALAGLPVPPDAAPGEPEVCELPPEGKGEVPGLARSPGMRTRLRAGGAGRREAGGLSGRLCCLRLAGSPP